MSLVYSNHIFAEIGKIKNTNSKKVYRKNQKLYSKERNRLRTLKYEELSSYTYEDTITIHSKTYQYNIESMMMVFTNADIINIIIGYLSYYSFITLSLVSRSFNKLFKDNMDIFMAISSRDYYTNFRNKQYKLLYRLETIHYRVNEYYSILNTCDWFYNSEFLIIYNNIFEYSNLSEYEIFMETYLSYENYIKQMRKCPICALKGSLLVSSSIRDCQRLACNTVPILR